MRSFILPPPVAAPLSVPLRQAFPAGSQKHRRCVQQCQKDSNGAHVHSHPQLQTSQQTSPEQLGLAWESDGGLAVRRQATRTTGLRRAPLSGGVSSATVKFDLPSPGVAVRNLVEHARYGHLCTIMSGMHHRRAGYPFGTLVDFAADGAGRPIFCLSPLAIHARNLLEEPRASLVVQMPGWTGLANARVTIFGDIHQLSAEQQAVARDVFAAKHATERKERWVSGNFVYFAMSQIVDIYFVGGFGTVQWISPSAYLSSRPDDIVVDNVTHVLAELNRALGQELKQFISPSPTHPIDELLFISIDAGGVDVRVRCGSDFNVERISFGCKVHTLEEAHRALATVLRPAAAASS
ncbi:hypothetical protein V8C86DRAFT_2520386 [Haematococcus lacustris]